MCEPYMGRGRGDNERVPSLVLERGSKMVVKSLPGTRRDVGSSRHKCKVEEYDR